MLRNQILFFFLFISVAQLSAQIGGRSSYEFVNVPVGAHAAGIGGLNVSVLDNDVTMIFQNPALLNDSMRGDLAASYIPYPGQVKSSSVATTFRTGKKMLWGTGLQYFNYGRMDQTDPDGTVIGTFSANEFAMLLGTSHKINNYTMGVSAKFVGSQIYSYWALATLFDIGGVFKHPTKNFTIGLVFKNVGTTWKRYTPGMKVSEPFDLQLGTSYKLEHFPLRFSLTAHHLEKFNITYNDTTRPSQFNFDGTPIIKKTSIGSNIMRHFVIGGEFMFSKNFQLWFGYNFLRRRELRIDSKSGGAGITIGGTMKIKSFQIGYTHAFYSLAGGSNHITIMTNLSSFVRKK